MFKFAEGAYFRNLPAYLNRCYKKKKQIVISFYIFPGNTMTTEKIVDRIIKHRIEFEQRNMKKEKKEIEVFEALTKAKQTEKAG